MKFLNNLEEKLEKIKDDPAKNKTVGKRKKVKEQKKAEIVDMEQLLSKVSVKMPIINDLIKGKVISITNTRALVQFENDTGTTLLEITKSPLKKMNK